MATHEYDMSRIEPIVSSITIRRHIVQIAGTADDIVALCSDGTVWRTMLGDNVWIPLPQIPQDTVQ